MSHWAEIDSENKVLRVLVGDNQDPAGDEGHQLLVDNFGGTWIKTSYNSTIRKKYACIGDSYDESLDAFISPKCHDEAILDQNTCQWICENEVHHVIS